MWLIRSRAIGEALACATDVDTSVFLRTLALVALITVSALPLLAQTPGSPTTQPTKPKPPSTAPASPSAKPANKPAAPANQTAAAVAEFNDRIKEYIALHRKLANETGEISDTKKPAEITLREQELGKLIRANRAAAKQGDIFTPAVQALFKGIIKQEYARRTAAMRKDRKEDQDELADFAPMVNQTYPPEKPLVTFPAGLLRTLPQLPRELEYRLVQRNLILRDIEANIIVDFIPAATP